MPLIPLKVGKTSSPEGLAALNLSQTGRVALTHASAEGVSIGKRQWLPEVQGFRQPISDGG
ncbi:hypothetical protein P40081_02665 [Paenibacillus sp. FSL P4-0081]|nr:hypothetical protein P40081_02665 [Paenibacillus sp. FSL P4-0081]OMF20361.1 hypothetical protein BK132_34890 [Paenibacillus sp. FSL H8-0259]